MRYYNVVKKFYHNGKVEVSGSTYLSCRIPDNTFIFTVDFNYISLWFDNSHSALMERKDTTFLTEKQIAFQSDPITYQFLKSEV